jgi:hypothetical protein
MKSPPVQHRDEVARQMVAAFIDEHGRGPTPQEKSAPAPALVAD